MSTRSTRDVAAGDRIKWGAVFGKVDTVVHAIRDGERRVGYARLSLDSGERVLLTPETDTTPLEVVYRVNPPLRLVKR